MIGLIVWLVCVLLIVAAVLALLRAVLALEPLALFQPYANVVYALVVLLIVVLVVQAILGGGPLLGTMPRWRG